MSRSMLAACVAVFGMSQAADEPTRDLTDVLTPDQWQDVDKTVDRGLRFLASKQQPDGSFAAPESAPASGQPGITGLCVMAFLSRGHLPEQGVYGKQLTRAIDFVIATQRAGGVFSYLDVELGEYASHTALYNHGIAGLMLTEVYGMAPERQEDRLQLAIPRAIRFTLEMQNRIQRASRDHGGWRYYDLRESSNADLSVTAWQLMFLRSAKNADFEVPVECIDRSMAYV